MSDRQLYTINQIEDLITTYPKNTLRYAIRRLLEHNLVKSVSNLKDMRTVYYRISSESEISDSLSSLAPNIASRIQSAIKFDDRAGQMA